MTIRGTNTINYSQCAKEAAERNVDTMTVVFEYNARNITVIMYK